MALMDLRDLWLKRYKRAPLPLAPRETNAATARPEFLKIECTILKLGEKREIEILLAFSEKLDFVHLCDVLEALLY
jgi:hypothetical protein